MADNNKKSYQWFEGKVDEQRKAKKKHSKKNKKMQAPVPPSAQMNKPNPQMQGTKPAPAADKAFSPEKEKMKREMENKARAEAEAKKAQEIQKAKERKAQKAMEKAEKNKKKKLSSKKNAEKKALRNGIMAAAVAAIALFVLSFVIYHLYNYIAEKPQFSFITSGAVEHTIGAKALIVRDEIIVSGKAEGELVTQTTEGSKVSKGQRIAMIVPEDMSTTVENLRNVQSQISDVQQELISSGTDTSASKIYKDYNSKIEPVIDMIRLDSSSGKLRDLSSYSSSVNVLLDERETLLAEINFDDERLRVLRGDEKNYETQLENNSSMIYAGNPGIVSFRLDGLESELPFDQFLTMDIASVKGMINKASGAITSDLKIKSGENVARLAKNEKQYFAVYLNSSDSNVSDFAVGTLHDINISSEGISISDCEVVRCENDQKGTLIVFSTGRYVETLLDLRSVDIEIVISETSGLRVPVSSLVDKDLSSSNGFSVYFEAGSGVVPESFAVDSEFNINIVPKPKADSEGNIPEVNNIICPGCKVVSCETFEDGSIIVGFVTINDYSGILRVNSNKSFTDYQAVFVDANSGLGTTVDHIITTSYAGIGSVYVNNQGFVEAQRVIITDYDREFAVIRPIGKSNEPGLDTVIITNPQSCKPGDKVG